jgi:hypothetical protein
MDLIFYRENVNVMPLIIHFSSTTFCLSIEYMINFNVFSRSLQGSEGNIGLSGLPGTKGVTVSTLPLQTL